MKATRQKRPKLFIYKVVSIVLNLFFYRKRNEIWKYFTKCNKLLAIEVIANNKKLVSLKFVKISILLWLKDYFPTYKYIMLLLAFNLKTNENLCFNTIYISNWIDGFSIIFLALSFILIHFKFSSLSCEKHFLHWYAAVCWWLSLYKHMPIWTPFWWRCQILYVQKWSTVRTIGHKLVVYFYTIFMVASFILFICLFVFLWCDFMTIGLIHMCINGASSSLNKICCDYSANTILANDNFVFLFGTHSIEHLFVRFVKDRTNTKVKRFTTMIITSN